VVFWLVKNTAQIQHGTRTTCDKNGYSEFRMLLLQSQESSAKSHQLRIPFQFLGEWITACGVMAHDPVLIGLLYADETPKIDGAAANIRVILES